MCKGSGLLGALVGAGLAYVTGGASLGFSTLATAASLGATIGGALDKPKTPEAPTAGAAPNPVADEAANQDSARVADVRRRRAVAGGGPRSLLATVGGAAGDSSPAQIGIATANPGTKTALGA